MASWLGASAHVEAVVAAHNVGHMAQAEVHLEAAEHLRSMLECVTGGMCFCCLNRPYCRLPNGLR